MAWHMPYGTCHMHYTTCIMPHAPYTTRTATTTPPHLYDGFETPLTSRTRLPSTALTRPRACRRLASWPSRVLAGLWRLLLASWRARGKTRAWATSPSRLCRRPCRPRNHTPNMLHTTLERYTSAYHTKQFSLFLRAIGAVPTALTCMAARARLLLP